MKKLLILFLISVILLSNVYSHPGGIASDGCHYCRTNCDYWGVPWNERHCHFKLITEETPATTPTEPTTQETTSNSQNEPEPISPKQLENLQRKREEQIEQGLIQPSQEQCKGCFIEDKCLQYGSRLVKGDKSVYCDFNTELIKIQKQNDEQCQNNYECLSNSCGSGVCQDINKRIQGIEQELKEQRSLLQTILDFFSKLFS